MLGDKNVADFFTLLLKLCPNGKVPSKKFTQGVAAEHKMKSLRGDTCAENAVEWIPEFGVP